MNVTEKAQSATIWLWAGLALGGNLIAAPAKFQVASLTTAELLLVGRAQFGWLGYAEMTLAAAIITAALVLRRLPSLGLIAALPIFGLQQIVLTPLLQARSDLMQTGVMPPESHAHLVFIAAEVLKLGLLIWAGWRSLQDGDAQRPDVQQGG